MNRLLKFLLVISVIASAVSPSAVIADTTETNSANESMVVSDTVNAEDDGIDSNIETAELTSVNETDTDDYELDLMAVTADEPGTWQPNGQHKLTQSDGVTTITVPGTVTTKSLYTYYALTNPITDGKRVKISLEVNANDKLKATPTSYGNNTSIRFDNVGGNFGGGTHSICSPFDKPSIRTNDYNYFNIADSANGLAVNEWHTYECVFEFDTARNKRILKYVSVDGVETWCNFEKNGASLAAIAFFLTNGTSDENDAVLKVRNINVEGNYTTGEITVTPSFEDGAVGIDAKDMTLTFSESLVYDCDIKDIISIVDEENNPIASEKYSVTMNSDKKVATVTMNTDDTDSQKTYKIFIDKSKVKGNSFNDFPNDVYLSFTLPVIKAKATLGISSELEDGVENITPANMKFNFIPLPNDRIEDVSAYDISVDERTDMNSVIKVKNSDGSIAEDVIVDAELAEDCKSFTVSLSNYERYTQYTMEISNGSIVGSDGELMKGDFTFTFGTGEIDKPPYIGYSLGYTVDWRGQLTNEDKDGVTTFSYKNSVAQGNSSQKSEICYRLDEAISNAEGPIEVTYKFQINEGLANSTGGSLTGILSDSNRGGFMFVTGMAGTSTATDYTHYIRFYEKSALKVGVEDGDEWNTIKYIFDVDNGVVKNGYIQINDKAPINVTTIENTKTNFGVVEFRLYSMPNENGEYEDYIFKVKDMSVKSLGALKGTATSDDNENISLRFSYNVPYLFESDIKLLEWNDKAGDYTEVKQGYSVDEMDPSDMKQVNIHVTNGGLAYNKKYRVAVCRTDITAEDYVKLKITDIDFVTKEYPDNMKADVTLLTPSDNTTIVNCSIVNLQDEASSAYVIVAGYNEAGEMVDKYCENINSIGGDNSHGINNISLSGSIKNVKVFIFKDDEGFDIYHMPQSFER